MIKNLSFRKHGPEPARPEAFAAFEAKLAVRLPHALAEFCSRWNGGFPSGGNSFYYVPPAFREFHEEYGPQSKGVTVDGLYGLTLEPRGCGLEKECLALSQVSTIGMIPISFDLFGNYVVLRSDSPGGLVYWRDHELWQAPELPHLMPIAPDLEFFYNSLTQNPLEREG